MATLTEQAERFDNMADHMRAIAQMGSDLNPAERNLLSVAYKQAVGARRQAWRAVTTFEQQGPKGETYAELAQNYRRKIEKEMHEKCTELLQLLRDDLIPKCTEAGPTVFYQKLKGDYLRYLSEFSTGEWHSRYAQEAHDAYQAASDIALSRLQPTDPIRLGLALNFSVFYYEVFSAPEKACLLAKAAFNDAMNVMDQLSPDDYADSSTILQLLRDNLTLWTADMRTEPEAMKTDDAD
jgi:hypothetical protein